MDKIVRIVAVCLLLALLTLLLLIKPHETVTITSQSAQYLKGTVIP